MQDWIKIQSFDRIHQAELRKDILEKNDIEAVIINERDSLFLFGDIELYVQKKDEKRALALIEEFQGLTKVNSFILHKPIALLKDILDLNSIYAVIKKREDENYVLENFELYVRNEDVSKTVPFLTGEKLIGWKHVSTSVHTRQTRFRVELLEENKIDSIVIKKRNSEFHLEEIFIYVKSENEELAKKIMTELIGWIKVGQYEFLHRAEIREDLLGRFGIRSIINQISNNQFDLLVECSNEEKAIDVINQHREWTKIQSYPDIITAEYVKEILEESSIDCILINRKDRTFLLGDIDIYVDDFHAEKASEIVKELETIE